MEDQWLSWVKRLQAIATTGKNFFEGPYDLERYTEIDSIAQQMLAALASENPGSINRALEPLADGYITPKVDVRGAVIVDQQILLVQEKTDGLWTLPGGYADVGLSPSENVIKEVAEEAGIHIIDATLYAVRHKARHQYNPDIRDFYKFFFLCQPADTTPPQPGEETIAVKFFNPNELPPLSQGRTIARDITDAFNYQLEKTAVIID